MRLGQDIVLGGKVNLTGSENGGGRIPEIIESYDYDFTPVDVANLILGKHGKRYLGQMLHGDVDVDQLDYLVRDAHYTGVAHGIIDLERLMKVLRVHDNELVVDEKGVEAVEGMMVARASCTRGSTSTTRSR